MEKYVVSRELAERLRLAGYPQNAHFFWLPDCSQPLYLTQLPSKLSGDSSSVVAAPLSDELLEHLPDTIHLPESKGMAYLEMNRIRKTVKYDYRDGYGSICDDLVEYPNAPNSWYDKPADALAELWLFCKKEGHLDA